MQTRIQIAMGMTALAAVLLWGWLGWKGGQVPAPDPASISVAAVGSQPETASKGRVPRRPAWLRAGGAETRPSTPKPPRALPGETVLRFSTRAAWERFLSQELPAGITVLDAVSALNAVRIGYADQLARESLRRLADDVAFEDDNYYVWAPPFPAGDKSSSGSYFGFGATAARWLGAPRDRHDWGAGITVAVLDSGIADHQAFAGMKIIALDLLPEDAVREGDYVGHGTAVASILAGSGPETSGVSPGVQLLSMRVLDGDGFGDTFTIARGIIEAVDRGARVINLSLGSYGDSQILEEAVAYAVARDVVLVAATGNDGVAMPQYPAAYDGVIAVTAVDAAEQRLDFANHGTGTDLAAPGYEIYAAWPGDALVSFTGTSAAVPFVSGAVAMLLADAPGLTAAQTADLLLAYSNDAGLPGPDAETGTGLLDLGRLAERNTAGIYDMAVAGIAVDPGATDAGITIVVSAQNRGTEVVPAAELTVTVGDRQRQVQFASLDVGQTVSTRVVVSADVLAGAGELELQGAVRVIGPADAEPSNDERQSRLISTGSGSAGN